MEGNRQYNPGWHLALDLRNMLLVSEAVAKAALERKESRGGHTRDDYPMTDYDFWGKLNVIVELAERPRSGERHALSASSLCPNAPDRAGRRLLRSSD